MTLRLWIDTDLGDNPDDSIALLCAAAHPGIELVGVSTVSGDVLARAETVRDLLGAANVAVPLVYAGPPDPRALDMAEAVLAIGPLTNLAAMLRSGVELPPTSIVGGVFEPTEHRGVLRTVEANFGADPMAAAVVVANAPDLLITPLDVTAAMLVDDATTARLAAAVPALSDELESWRAAEWPLCLHDPLALLALVGEHVRIERRSLGVTVEGRLVVDERDGVGHDVVVFADIVAATRRVRDLVFDLGVTEGTRTPGLRDHNPTL